MNIIQTEIPGVLILEPKVFGDARGYFFESFNTNTFDQEVLPLLKQAGILSDAERIRFVQDNESKSIYGVVRGLHYQKSPYAQSKLVRVVRGEVLDVAVDLRRGSPTFGRHVEVLLTEDNHRQFFIPRGFAHGFSVLSDEAVFQYKCDEYYHPEAEAAISWNDPALGIDWRIPSDKVVLSAKDSCHPCLDDATELFD